MPPSNLKIPLTDMLSSFWQSTKIKKDPDQIWLDLCQAGPLQARAVKHCKKFLRIYATARKRKEVTLGPEKYETKQSVKSASTILGYWRHLVQEVDRTLLAKKRRENPHNKSQWSLKVHDGLFVNVKYGPIWEVTCVSPFHRHRQRAASNRCIVFSESRPKLKSSGLRVSNLLLKERQHRKTLSSCLRHSGCVPLTFLAILPRGSPSTP